MSRVTLAACFALLAFAANSILCRMALRQTTIDPASFTRVRLVAGAVTLWTLVRLGKRRLSGRGNWASSVALLAYATAFSLAYVDVTAATGALPLFGAVQLIMILTGLAGGERIGCRIALDWRLAVAGLLILVFPGVSAPPPIEAALMLCAGVAWGIYSLRGRRSNEPLRDTAGGFVQAAPGALLAARGTLHGRHATTVLLLTRSILTERIARRGRADGALVGLAARRDLLRVRANVIQQEHRARGAHSVWGFTLDVRVGVARVLLRRTSQ